MCYTSSHMEQTPPPASPAAHTFYAVPIWKFIVLTIVSSGLYPLYWFWFNWKLIRDQEHKDFSPILRALFSFLYFSDLARTVLNAAKAKQYPETYNPTLLAWVFFIGILGSLSNSWIGGIIGIVGFLMVIPIIRAMAYVNSHTEGSSIQTKLTTSEIVVALIGIGFWILSASFLTQSSFGA